MAIGFCRTRNRFGIQGAGGGLREAGGNSPGSGQDQHSPGVNAESSGRSPGSRQNRLRHLDGLRQGPGPSQCTLWSPASPPPGASPCRPPDPPPARGSTASRSDLGPVAFRAGNPP